MVRISNPIQKKTKIPALILCHVFISQHMTTKIKLRPNNLGHNKAVTQVNKKQEKNEIPFAPKNNTLPQSKKRKRKKTTDAIQIVEAFSYRIRNYFR